MKGRINEPSTWAGLGAVFGGLAWVPGAAGVVLGALGAACGGVAVYLRERAA